MCKHGTYKKVWCNYAGNSGKHLKNIDSCIADEIQTLNKKGVITVGCCCGHGKFEPEALISEESVELCKSLGYKVREYSEQHTKNGIYEILLKTGGR